MMEKMNRKGIISLILVVAMMFVVVFGVRQASPVNGENTNGAPAAGGGNFDAADGTYIGEADGFGGKIVAEVTVEDGMITEIKVTGDKETEGLGSVAVEKLPEKLLEAQSLDVDTVSGATISSKAVLLAVTNALAEAK